MKGGEDAWVIKIERRVGTCLCLGVAHDDVLKVRVHAQRQVAAHRVEPSESLTQSEPSESVTMCAARLAAPG